MSAKKYSFLQGLDTKVKALAEANGVKFKKWNNMSELIEIILQAVDDSLSGTADTVSSDFTSMEENVSGFQTAVSSIDSSSIDELATELGMSTEEVERLITSGAQIGHKSEVYNSMRPRQVLEN